MNRRIVIGFFSILFGSMIALALSVALLHRNHTRQPAMHFEFKDIYGQKINSAAFMNHLTSVVICIDPDCSACQGEIRGISRDTGLIGHVNLLIVVESAAGQAASFLNGLPVALKHCASLVIDTGALSRSYFGAHVLPSTYLYSASGAFVKCWQGEVSALALDQYSFKQ